MKNLYEISYEAKRTINGKNPTWNGGKLHVLANGSIEKAILKAKKHLMGDTYTFHKDGVKLVEKCIDVRVTSAELLASVDVV